MRIAKLLKNLKRLIRKLLLSFTQITIQPKTPRKISGNAGRIQTAFEKLKNVHVNKDGEEYEKETTETAGEFMELINKLLHFPDIEVELCGSWIWVSGETKAVKDDLKA